MHFPSGQGHSTEETRGQLGPDPSRCEREVRSCPGEMEAGKHSRVEKEKEEEEGGSHSTSAPATAPPPLAARRQWTWEHALNCWLYFKRPTIIISSRCLIGWKAKRSYSVRTGNRESGLRSYFLAAGSSDVHPELGNPECLAEASGVVDSQGLGCETTPRTSKGWLWRQALPGSPGNLQVQSQRLGLHQARCSVNTQTIHAQPPGR